MNKGKPTLWVVNPSQNRDREGLFPSPALPLLREVNLLGSLAIFFFFFLYLHLYSCSVEFQGFEDLEKLIPGPQIGSP